MCRLAICNGRVEDCVCKTSQPMARGIQSNMCKGIHGNLGAGSSGQRRASSYRGYRGGTSGNKSQLQILLDRCRTTGSSVKAYVHRAVPTHRRGFDRSSLDPFIQPTLFHTYPYVLFLQTDKTTKHSMVCHRKHVLHHHCHQSDGECPFMKSEIVNACAQTSSTNTWRSWNLVATIMEGTVRVTTERRSKKSGCNGGRFSTFYLTSRDYIVPGRPKNGHP